MKCIFNPAEVISIGLTKQKWAKVVKDSGCLPTTVNFSIKSDYLNATLIVIRSNYYCHHGLLRAFIIHYVEGRGHKRTRFETGLGPNRSGTLNCIYIIVFKQITDSVAF